MTITRQDGGGIRYYGLSGDTKPTDAPAGSKYHETDTGDVYTYSGSAWFQAGSDASGGATSAAGDVAAGVADSGNPVKVGGKYNATAPTLDDLDRGDAQLDVNGNWKVVIGAVEVWSFFDTIADDVDISVKASAGHLMAIETTNENAAVRYLQFHNKATAPANPDVPVYSMPIPAGTSTVPGRLKLTQADLGPGGRAFSTGIAVGISTTAATFTAATAAEHNTSGGYV